MKNIILLKTTLVFFAFGLFFLFVLTNTKETFAAYFGGNQYFNDPPSSYTEYPCDACPGQGTCWNSETAGQTDCGEACEGGNAWTKYNYVGCYVNPNDETSEECTGIFDASGAVCSTGDKCIGGETGLHSGSCDCGYGGTYKYCCTDQGNPESCTTGGATQDNNWPSEGQCPGGYLVDGNRVRSNACTPVCSPNQGQECGTYGCCSNNNIESECYNVYNCSGQCVFGGIRNEGSYCGNGACSCNENSSNCPSDCGQPPPSCGNGQCSSGETCSSCPQDCGACPPQQKYSCSGSSCVFNPNGPYTTSNCNNACSAPPGGCSVSWTLSNPNPPPGSSIQVKVRGLSDPQGWQNIGLYLDNSTTGSWGGIENPWPTFVYNNVPAGAGGGHTLQFRTNNGSRTCSPNQTFTTQSTAPTNLQVSGVPACAAGPYNATLSWQNTNSTLWLDLSTNNFADFVNKNVSNQTSTQVPAGMPGVTLNANTTYQWRLWNGSSHTQGPSFFAPFCQASVTGRMWRDNNGDGVWQSAGEKLIKSELPHCSESNPNYLLPNLGVTYTGPFNFTNFPNGCNNQAGYGSAPYYSTGSIPTGDYTFQAQGPANWRLPPARTFTLAPGQTRDEWWGLNPPPENISVTKPDCSNGPYNVTLNWNNTTTSPGTLYLDISSNASFASYSNKDVSGTTATQVPAGFNPFIQLQPGTTYFSRFWNFTGVHTPGPGWSVPLCLGPWIQVQGEGGDVHSQTRINTPGGP